MDFSIIQDFFRDFLQQIVQTSTLEWIATISGFFCVHLATKQNIWNWPISIISVGCYLYIFYHSKLYGDSILQIYFLGTAIYGWYYWHKIDASEDRSITSLSNYQLIIATVIIIILGTFFGYILNHWTDTDVPYIDGLCTSMSLVAQILMTRKVLQNWVIWVIVDICYIPLYIHKNLVMTAILYLLFAFVAWNGYQSWKKSLIHTNNPN